MVQFTNLGALGMSLRQYVKSRDENGNERYEWVELEPDEVAPGVKVKLRWWYPMWFAQWVSKRAIKKAALDG